MTDSQEKAAQDVDHDHDFRRQARARAALIEAEIDQVVSAAKRVALAWAERGDLDLEVRGHKFDVASRRFEPVVTRRYPSEAANWLADIVREAMEEGLSRTANEMREISRDG